MALRVLVVDDSALMRKYIAQILEEGLGAEVCLARDGADALEGIRQFDPDVVTLDINMPVMDGLTCLSHIMTEMPCPVVMVSSLTERDALVTFEALQMGAVDYVPKPGGTVSLNIKSVAAEICDKVKTAGHKSRLARVRRRARQARLREPAAPAPPPPPPPAPAARRALSPGDGRDVRLVLVGVSTGGPSTLEAIVPRLPADFPAPVLVAQHMAASFTKVFARRLDSMSQLRVVEVDRRTKLERGTVYIAQGGADVVVNRLAVGMVASPVPETAEYVWHPAVDLMVKSALGSARPEQLIGVLLTGMGWDGAETMAQLHREGGRTIAESEETAVIYGMPQELVSRQGAGVVLPNDRIADQLIAWAMPGRRA